MGELIGWPLFALAEGVSNAPRLLIAVPLAGMLVSLLTVSLGMIIGKSILPTYQTYHRRSLQYAE
jgi:hypothetical protein